MEPVYRSERAPTYEDAGLSKSGMWMDMGDGRVLWSQPGSVNAENCYAFYPNPPMPDEPEPLVKPKPERVSGWVNVYRDGNAVLFRDKDAAERAGTSESIRIAHLREVLPGDPTPEAIAEVVGALQDLIKEGVYYSETMKHCIRKLEGK